MAWRLIDLGARVWLLDSLVPDLGGNRFNVHGIEDRLTTVIGDQGDRQLVESLLEGCDFVFNLAGQISHLDSMVRPQDDLEMNCRIHLVLLEACRRVCPEATIVFASTRQLYGKPCRLPITERHPIEPIDINGIHKRAGESYHWLYRSHYGLDCRALRLSNVFGPRQLVRHDRQGVIGWFVRQAIEGNQIRLFGGGRQRRDPLYVEDAVEAFLSCAAHPEAAGEVFNVGGDRFVALAELADILREITGRGEIIQVEFPPERDRIEIGDVFLDSSKIHRRLGWKPAFDLEHGLRRTVEFYRTHGEHYW